MLHIKVVEVMNVGLLKCSCCSRLHSPFLTPKLIIAGPAGSSSYELGYFPRADNVGNVDLVFSLVLSISLSFLLMKPVIFPWQGDLFSLRAVFLVAQVMPNVSNISNGRCLVVLF